MTTYRKSLLENVKRRLEYYTKQGYHFSGLSAESLSTRELSNLVKKKGKQFLKATKADITRNGTPLAEIRKSEYESYRRNRALKSISEKISRYEKQGYSVSDLTALDLVTVSTDDLQRIRNMDKFEFLSKFGSAYTYKAKAPLAKAATEFTVTAEEGLALERAERKAALARRRNKMEPLSKDRYVNPANIRSYIEGLERMSAPGYKAERDQRMTDNFFKMLSFDARYMDDAKYLMDKLNEMPRSYVTDKLVEGYKRGMDWNLLKVYGSKTTNFYSMYFKALQLFGIEDRPDRPE